jgi:hypothetical protein
MYAVNFRAGSIGFPSPGEENLSNFTETFHVVGEPLLDITTLAPTVAITPAPTTAPTSSGANSFFSVVIGAVSSLALAFAINF